MARLPRLALAGHAHLVLLRGHNGQSVFTDEVDRSDFLLALQGACARERVALHAYALLEDRVWLLCTPGHEHGLSRAMQALGRRFAVAFNRRHRRSGSLWDGRYRSTLVEPGAALLEVMVFIDQAGIDRSEGLGGDTTSTVSSTRQHLGYEGPIGLIDAPEYWALGNTPFERASAYRRLVEEPLGEAQRSRIDAAALKGWPLGSPAYLSHLRSLIRRPLGPRPRGRPRKQSLPTRAE